MPITFFQASTLTFPPDTAYFKTRIAEDIDASVGCGGWIDAV